MRYGRDNASKQELRKKKLFYDKKTKSFYDTSIFADSKYKDILNLVFSTSYREVSVINCDIMLCRIPVQNEGVYYIDIDFECYCVYTPNGKQSHKIYNALAYLIRKYEYDSFGEMSDNLETIETKNHLRHHVDYPVYEIQL